MKCDIINEQFLFDTSFEYFKEDWRHGEIKTFSDAIRILGEPLDAAELEKIFDCAYEILSERKKKYDQALEICEYLRILNPNEENQEENQDERR